MARIGLNRLVGPLDLYKIALMRLPPTSRRLRVKWGKGAGRPAGEEKGENRTIALPAIAADAETRSWRGWRGFGRWGGVEGGGWVRLNLLRGFPKGGTKMRSKMT